MHQGYIHLTSLSALSLPTQHPLQYTQSESLLPLCSHRPLLSLNHCVYLTVIHSINSLIQTIPDDILLLPDTVLGHFVVVNQGWHITIIIFCEELNKTFLKLKCILSSLRLLLPRTCSIKHWLSCHFLLSQLSTARKMCSENVCTTVCEDTAVHLGAAVRISGIVQSLIHSPNTDWVCRLCQVPWCTLGGQV